MRTAREGGVFRVQNAEEGVTTIFLFASVRPVRDHHTTVVIETGDAAFLYVIGGTDAWKTLHDDVLRARIDEDGSLGDFAAVGKLPESRAGHTTVVVGHRVIVAGGHTMDDTGTMSTLDSTISATVSADGTLGPWTPGPKLPTPVMHHTCDVVGSFIYCVGGRIDHNFTGTFAVRMAVGEDGTLGPYEPITPFGQSIGFHMAFVHDHALYVAGGLHRDAPMPDFDQLRGIWRLPIAEDGAAGAWESAGALPSARSVGTAQVLRDHAYFVGGQDATGAVSSTILAATLTANGQVTDIHELPTKLSVAPRGQQRAELRPEAHEVIQSQYRLSVAVQLPGPAPFKPHRLTSNRLGHL